MEPDVPHILVVDDERVIADTLSLILCHVGYSVTSAYSGEEAIEAASQRPPDLLISDVLMGEMSGIDLAVLMKQRFPDCGTILLSGQATTARELKESLRRAVRGGYAFEVLAKPISPTEILDRIKRFFGCRVSSSCLA